jgi:peptide/nickel transport system substrate-binding protein
VPSCIRVGVAILAGLALAIAPTGSASTRAVTKYGGTLVVGLSMGDPDTLDPTTAQGRSSAEIFGSMCASLYRFGPVTEVIPWLAAALPVVSKDKLTYTVKLRQGVRFNDGTPFNAQAVVTTVERYMTYPRSTRATAYQFVESVTAPDPATVVFHLRERNSSFVANPAVLSPTQLAKVGDGFAADPVCAGPFMFDHRVVGDHVTVIKSPWYFDQKNVFLDKIVYKAMPNGAAAAAALKAGDIQVLDAISPTELADVRESSSVRVLDSPQHGWMGVVFNIGNRNGAPPYANVGTPLASSAKLRQAFEEAIDRDALNRVVFGGLFQPSCSAIPPANIAWYEGTKVPCTPYNPKHARQLVAASGFSNPTVRLMTRNTSDELRLAEFVQAQEAAVGIDVVIEPTDQATALARARGGSFDAYLFSIFAGPTDPNGFIQPYLATTGTQNFCGYTNPQLDLILANGLKATSANARSTLYRAAQRIVAADRPIVYLYNRVGFVGVSRSVVGVQRMDAGASQNVVYGQFK